MLKIAVLTLSALLVGAFPTFAQYFGRNKVNYEDFDFRVLETPHFDVYHYAAEEEAIGYAARLAERWHARLAQALDHELVERQPVVFYASHSHFAQTTVLRGFLGEGTGGVTEHQRGRVVMPFAASLGDTDHVLGHELVHAFQRDILRDHGGAMAALPLWFLEGMAEHLSVGWLDTNTVMWLRDSLADEQLPTIEQLDDPRWFPYRYGQALWAYVTDQYGQDVVPRALKMPGVSSAIGRLVAATGVDAETLSAGWHEWIRHVVAATPQATQPVKDSAGVISHAKGGGRLNVAPALSPNGEDLAFLSERDEFSIDMYLADAETGTIKQRLVETAADPHFDSLQFIGSAGAWDPDGRRIALAAIHRGQPVLTILEARTGTAAREIALPDLDEAFNPSWSPDGKQLVFSALKGGLSDLYVIDLESERVRPLTSDAFADLQPAWSPDGRSIAFATDRFSSSVETLHFGNLQLGTLDVVSGEIRSVRAFDAARHIDPQWSADGSSVYFLADPGQRSNVYRVDVRSGELFQVTDLNGGVSGVTATSPALSVAADARVLAFSLYRHGAYELHVMKAEDGAPVVGESAATAARASVPSRSATPSTFGLVDGQEFTVKPYRRGLSLDGMGQPYLSAGGGSFGTFFQAGVSFAFADMLGQHALRTALQVGKSAADFGAQVTYLNRQSRWNWAVGAEQVPMTIGASRTSRQEGGTDGTSLSVLNEHVLFRQIHRRLTGAAIYPYSSAHRLELSSSLHSISLTAESKTSEYLARTGELIAEASERAQARPPATLFETGAALVYDSAVVGPTSPILGTRYRLEVAPTLGDLSFVTLLADYRRYTMPARPFTLALRVKHAGRYGVDAADTRLLPLAFNVNDRVRGYSARTLADEVCGRESAACAASQYLGTQHLFLANLEWRFPIVGALRGTRAYGPLPIEGMVFSDTGWFRLDAREPGGAARWRMQSSAGGGVRLNAAGLVFELGAAYRLVGNRGWGMVVNFRPGF